MNWKLILLLSLFGLVMGIGSVYVIPTFIEPLLWLMVFLVSALVIARYAGGRYFLHGFLVSLANTFWVIVTQVALFYTYIANHPEYLAMTNSLSPALAAHPRRLMVPKGLIIGIITGVVLGLISWLASRLVSPKIKA